MSGDSTIGEGFEPHFRKSKFTDPWEPLYSKVERDQVRLGVVLSEAHCNSRSLVHGAFLTAIGDNALGLSIGFQLKSMGREASGLVTVSLSIDFLGKAQIGEWVYTDTSVHRITGSMGFATTLIQSNQQPVARVSASFRV